MKRFSNTDFNIDIPFKVEVDKVSSEDEAEVAVSTGKYNQFLE